MSGGDRPDPASKVDPRGLIREAYRIDGITDEDCRTIFLDWVLGMPDQSGCLEAMRVLLEIHGDNNPVHPMTRLLREGQVQPTADRPRRRRRSSGSGGNSGNAGSRR